MLLKRAFCSSTVGVKLHTRSTHTIESVFVIMLRFWSHHQPQKNKVLSQGTDIPPTIKIDNKYIENVKHFVYLGSSIASNASMATEINCCIGKDSGTFARLIGRVWYIPKIIIRTKSNVYCVCVYSTLPYGSERRPCRIIRRRTPTKTTNDSSVVFLESGDNIRLSTKK